jgi:large subunit ribosomal protein L32
MGAICPKKKTSKARRDKRRAQTWKISLPNLADCPKCGELMRSHRACKACGTYNKKEVVKVS